MPNQPLIANPSPRGAGYRNRSKSTALAKLKIPGAPGGLTPHQVGQIRRAIFEEVNARMDDASLVLRGKKSWTPQQVALFKALLNKVVPEITHSTQLSFSGELDPRRVSREQLEEMVAQFSVIEAEYDVIDELDERELDDGQSQGESGIGQPAEQQQPQPAPAVHEDTVWESEEGVGRPPDE